MSKRAVNIIGSGVMGNFIHNIYYFGLQLTFGPSGHMAPNLDDDSRAPMSMTKPPAA